MKSNIYKALEEAQVDLSDVIQKVSTLPEVIVRTVPATPQRTDFATIPRFGVESDMLSLTQSLATLLPVPEKNVIQFMSSCEGEGTSTLIRELAMAFAEQNGKPVLLADTDVRQLSHHRIFGIESKRAMDQNVLEEKALESVISRVGNTNLFLTTLSAKFLSSPAYHSSFMTHDLWGRLRKHFSLILFDSPPASSASDGLAFCATVDGIVLVIEAGKTKSMVAQHVRDQILMRGGNLLGIAFNKRRFYIPASIYKHL